MKQKFGRTLWVQALCLYNLISSSFLSTVGPSWALFLALLSVGHASMVLLLLTMDQKQDHLPTLECRGLETDKVSAIEWGSAQSKLQTWRKKSYHTFGVSRNFSDCPSSGTVAGPSFRMLGGKWCRWLASRPFSAIDLHALAPASTSLVWVAAKSRAVWHQQELLVLLRGSSTSISSLPHLILVCSLLPLHFCSMWGISHLLSLFFFIPFRRSDWREGKEKQRPE